jgi:kinesin family member 3A
MEERYSSLQEEVQGKTRKLRKVWTLLHSAKSEMDDLRQEHQRQMESLLEGVRQLTKELKLSTLLVDEYIPIQYQVRNKNKISINTFSNFFCKGNYRKTRILERRIRRVASQRSSIRWK